MAYSGTRLEDLIERYQLRYQLDVDLLARPVPVAPGALLGYYLAGPAQRAVVQGTEQAKREAIVAPFLYEAIDQARPPVVLHSGMAFHVNDELNGYVDYLLARSPAPDIIDAPVLAVVEAKDDSISQGIGQCVAEMVASRTFNAARSRSGPVYGAVTTGSEWAFLKLDGDQLRRRRDSLFYERPEVVLGALVAVLNGEA